VLLASIGNPQLTGTSRKESSRKTEGGLLVIYSYICREVKSISLQTLSSINNTKTCLKTYELNISTEIVMLYPLAITLP
jgi:hypothetical protein